MIPLYMLGQVEESFWRHFPGPQQIMWVIIGVALGFALLFGLMGLPSNLRRYVVVGFTFLAGLPFVLKFFWPTPINADYAAQLPRNGAEGFGFWLNQAIDPVGKITNIMGGFLLGVGIYSLVLVHAIRIKRRSENYGFSILLLVSFATMAIVGFTDWRQRKFMDNAGLLNDPANWRFFQYAQDLLFEGLYQQMDAAMFSMIAFFILSAAYRAFRVRSVEATIMMASALILMLNLMGAITSLWAAGVDGLVGATGNVFLLNFNLNIMADWLRATMQIPAIRAIDFGVGLGALAMGLRLWLGLERGGVSS